MIFLPFCIFVENKIYVIRVEQPCVVFMVRYRNTGNNQHTGKKSVINPNFSIISVSPIVYIEVIPFRLRLPIL